MNYEQRQALKDSLPSGVIKDIARQNGMAYQNVIRFFSGYHSKDDVEIIKAVTNYIEDWQAKQRQAIDRLKRVLEA